MSMQPEVPRLADLADLGVTVEPSEQLGVVSVTAWANDGSSVTITWDEVAASASIRWVDGDQERLMLERETVSKISVGEHSGSICFQVWSRSDGLGGELVVRIGESVSVRDVLLRV